MLKRLLVENFKGFPEKTEVTFDQGVTLILGKNGAGKSSILYGVKFALFGNDKKEGVPRPNYDGHKESVAELDFIGKDGAQYQITYSYKPRGRDNRPEFYKYDLATRQYTEISRNELGLEDVFPYDLSLFNSVFFVEEGDLYKFISAKKDVWKRLSEHLSQLLHLDKLDNLYSSLQKTKKAYASKAKELGGELKSLKEEKIEERIETVKKELEQVEASLEELSQIDIASIEYLAKTKAQIEHLEDESTRLGEEVKSLRKQLSGVSLDEVSELISKKENEIMEIESELSRLKGELRSKEKMQHLYEGILELLEHVISKHENTCPTCRQSLSLEQAEESLTQATEEAKEFHQAVRALNERIKSLSESLKQKQDILRKINANYEQLTDTLSRLKDIQSELEKLRSKLAESSDLVSIQEQIETRKNLEIKKYTLASELEELTSRKSRLEELPDLIHYYKVREILLDQLMKATKTVHEQKLKQHLDPIESQLRKLIRRIKDENWDVSFEGSIEPVFRRIGVGDTYLYLDDLSGGEKTLVFLLFRWLLSKQIAGKPFLIMDDAINHLDETNRKLLFTILSEVLHLDSEPNYQLILTSYDSSLESLLSHFHPKVIRI